MFDIHDINVNITNFLKLCDIVSMRHTCKNFTKIKVRESKYDIMKSIIHYNDPKLLQYFIDVGYEIQINYISFVVIGGKLKLLKYLYKNFNIVLNSELVDIAYRCDCLDIAFWLNKKGISSNSFPTTDTGKILKYILNDSGWKFHNSLFKHFLESFYIKVCLKGYLNILKYILPHVESKDMIIVSAIIGGQMKILEYMYPFVIVEEHYLLAIEHNHFNILKWLNDKESCLTLKTFNLAIEKGYFDIIKWLFDNKCPYDKSSCIVAKELYILKWLRERNIPWDYTVVSNGSPNIAKWAKENGCDESSDTDMFNLFE